MNYRAFYESDIGPIEVTGSEKGILAVSFLDEKPAYDNQIHPCLKECINQLDEYFKGERKVFSINLFLQGTEFQEKVWNQLTRIPYGETASYKDIAVGIDNPNATRAVGSANGKNKIAIIVPCHRVITADGKIGGYAAGVQRKEWLLDHEKKMPRLP
ncbi:MAG: methylated-DNA--[protein]-cysteine S-methyltransferase [bacterium]|nr:methylated-DNA--[protein]-cysteine S-methyltransferase [bacterium]